MKKDEGMYYEMIKMSRIWIGILFSRLYKAINSSYMGDEQDECT